MFNQEKVFITGGTGSWGKELVDQIFKKYSPREIVIFSRGEYAQVEMKRKFNNSKLSFIIGDVRDKTAVMNAMAGSDIVFHLAALKQVPVCEENCWEAVMTNINGTKNIIDAAIESNVKKVVDVSTDKAVDPYNFYGITKACGEGLVINANQNNNNKNTSLVCIRGGNVIGTIGSVIPLFKDQIKEDNEITVTDEQMTRFLMSKGEAISLVLSAVNKSIGGETFVMRMSSAKMAIVCRSMIELLGNKDTKIKNIGIRPGEKIHEVLVSKNEVPRTKIIDDKYLVILPQYQENKLERYYKKYNQFNMKEFSSKNTHLYNKKELLNILTKEKWLIE